MTKETFCRLAMSAIDEILNMPDDIWEMAVRWSCWISTTSGWLSASWRKTTILSKVTGLLRFMLAMCRKHDYLSIAQRKPTGVRQCL